LARLPEPKAQRCRVQKREEDEKEEGLDVE
jgi:hypothetical protein